MTTWRQHTCDHGHRYELGGEAAQGWPHIDCPLCTATGGQVARLPDGITGRIGPRGRPWRYLRATPQ